MPSETSTVMASPINNVVPDSEEEEATTGASSTVPAPAASHIAEKTTIMCQDPQPTLVAAVTPAYGPSAPIAYSTMTAAIASQLWEEDDCNPWEEEDWIPLTKSGKQKTPNTIRNELQRYIDECKLEKNFTQTEIISTMGVNNNSFRRFMNPKTYKDQWSATSNGTYWAAAKLLARVKFEKDEAKKNAKKNKSSSTNTIAGQKRKSDDGTSLLTPPVKKTKAEQKAEMSELIERVLAVEEASYEDGVYDTCPQVVTKIKEFVNRDGMNKAMMNNNALGGVNSKSMNDFLSGKKQDQCGNVVYRRAYGFFEKLRILEGKKKSAARLRNEVENVGGFSLEKERAGRYIKFLPGIGMDMYH